MTDEPTYGQRFLAAWRRNSGMFGAFDYAEIQQMKAADREAFIRVLRERNAHLPYAAIQLLRESEPEDAARVIFAQAQMANQTSLLVFLAMM